MHIVAVGVLLLGVASFHSNIAPVGRATDTIWSTPLNRFVFVLQGYTPVKLLRGRYTGWLYVAIDIRGKEINLVIDTAGGSNTLSADWVHEHIPEVVGGKRDPAGNKPLIDVVWTGRRFYPRVRVGSVTAPLMVFQYQPQGFPDAVRRDGMRTCEGILGAPFLRYYSAVVDCGSDTLYLLDPARREAGLQGEWVATEVQDDGRRKTAVVKSEPPRLSVRGTDAVFSSGGVNMDFTPVLDLSKSPRHMDMITVKGEGLRAIYKLDGDTLVLAAELFDNGRSTQARPKAFTTAKGDPHSVVTFRRVKPKP